MAPLAAAKGLSLSLDLKENLPRIKADRDRITQVLTNLVNNAINFTEKGAITITAGHGHNFIEVCVKDTGMGIEKEDVYKLFHHFVRLDSEGTGMPRGTGLGLAISGQIIKAHKGKIWAESEFGKGSTFHFILPIQERREG
jgi:signal transduction histidine kinase